MTTNSSSAKSTGYASVTGAQVYYEMAGKGFPFVLLNGGDFDLRMWDDQFERFSQTYRVVRYDPRGHGKTTTIDVPFRYSDDLRELLEVLSISKAILLGLSIGGGTAIDFALQYPDRVAALILVSCVPSGFEFTSEAFQQFGVTFDTAFGKGDLIEAVEIYLRTWVDGPSRSPNQVSASVRERLEENLVHAFQMPEPPTPEPFETSAISRLGEIRVPTLIIQGDHDLPDLLTSADWLEKHIANSQKIIIPNAAHMVNMEYPEIFNRDVLNFLHQHQL